MQRRSRGRDCMSLGYEGHGEGMKIKRKGFMSRKETERYRYIFSQFLEWNASFSLNGIVIQPGT